jgi:hypothetical protein
MVWSKVLKDSYMSYIYREPCSAGFKLFYKMITKDWKMYSPEELVKFTPKPIYSTNNLVMKIFFTVFFTALILMVSCQKKPVKHLMFRLHLKEKSDFKKSS